MVTHTKLLIAAFILMTYVFAPLQEDIASTLNQLVGGTDKEWVYVRFEQYMGDKNRCKKGESWKFHKDGKVTITRCEDRQNVTEERRWTVTRLSAIDVQLKINDREFLILFVPAPAQGIRKEKMILRTKSNSKTDPTKDLVFYHEVD